MVRATRLQWVCGFIVIALGACATKREPNPVHGLVQAPPLEVRGAWNVRMPPDAKLPRGLTRTLCPEFSLIEIHDRDDFTRFCDGIGRQPDNEWKPDLENGALIGVVAHVGESLGPRWPVTIDSIRVHEGTGWIKARFHHGAFYPVSTASYCHLVFVPDLKDILAIEINRRTFLAQ